MSAIIDIDDDSYSSGQAPSSVSSSTHAPCTTATPFPSLANKGTAALIADSSTCLLPDPITTATSLSETGQASATSEKAVPATPTRSLSTHLTQPPALTVTTSRSIAPLTVPKNSEDQLVG